MIIAIDGPAASGKGTLARALADQLGFDYLDTGATYRMIALRVMETGCDSVEAAQWVAENAVFSDFSNPALRTQEVSDQTSRISVLPDVRTAAVSLQRRIADLAEKGVVLDGRDIGTVVCPTAEVKLYVTADPEIRAQRRAKELQSKGFDVTYETVLGDLRERDERDSTRSEAPLRPAEDAVMFDTSTMTIDQMVVKALDLIAGKQKA